MEKIEYIAPEMEVIEMKYKNVLLSGSVDSDGNADIPVSDD